MVRSSIETMNNYMYLVLAYLRKNNITDVDYMFTFPYINSSGFITFKIWNFGVSVPKISDLDLITDNEMNNEKKILLQKNAQKGILSLFKGMRYSSYTRIASFTLKKGEKLVGVNLQITADTVNQTFLIKLYDKTNKVSVIESPSLSNTSGENFDLGYVEYSPSVDSVIEVQFKNTSLTRNVTLDYICIYKI